MLLFVNRALTKQKNYFVEQDNSIALLHYLFIVYGLKTVCIR